MVEEADIDGAPFGRYRLIELLGRGGMGEVWRAFDTVTERGVALKLLPAHLSGDEEFQRRFRREAKAAARLREPHAVPIHDLGEIDGKLFVTMRLVDGCDLHQLLTRGPMDPGLAVGIIEQIASALDAAHRIGLVHRDVKPSNILVGEDDFAYLIDFGIARVIGETVLTSTGVTVGTWPYMAPERFRSGVADASADVYSLACVLYQALTCWPPFPGQTLEQIVAAHMFQPPPRPSLVRGDVPAAMDDVIATGMAKDPRLRFPTAKALARAARDALGGSAASVRGGLTESSQRSSGGWIDPVVPVAATSVDRPANVTAAAVLAFLCAIGPALIGVVGFVEGLGKRDVVYLITALVFAGVAGTLVWGGFMALRGATARCLRRPPLVFGGVLVALSVIALTAGTFALAQAIAMFALSTLMFLCSLLVRAPSASVFFRSRSQRR